MALGTYSELQTAMGDYLNRTDLNAKLPVFLASVEASVNRFLAENPVRPMHTVDNAFVIATEYVDAPSDIMDVDSLEFPSIWQMEATSPQNIAAMKHPSASYVSPLELTLTNSNPAPKFYAQVGGQFQFYPAPQTSMTATLTYWAKLPALTTVSNTNWLLTDHPDVYLYGVLEQAYIYLRDDNAASAAHALFLDKLEGVKDAYPSRPDHRPLRSEVPRPLIFSRSGWHW